MKRLTSTLPVLLTAVLIVASCGGALTTSTQSPTETQTPTDAGAPTTAVILSVLIEPTNSGSVEVERFGFYATESLIRLEQGEPVNLIVRPNRGWSFVHWRGALSGDQSSQPLVMDASKQVTAVFERKQPSTTAPGETAVVGTVTRPAQHNVIDLDGNTLEKYETGENLPGLYISLDLDRLGDFLQLYSDETFYLEEYEVGYSGRWEFNGNEIVLKIPRENP